MPRNLTHCCLCLLTGIAVMLTTPTLVAQGTPPPPPTILEILTESIKPGHNAAHLHTEAGWPRAFARANVAIHWLGMVQETGPGEAWFVSGYPSLAALEEANKAVEAAPGLGEEIDRLWTADGEHVSGTSRILARYRPELSNFTGVVIPTMRYFQILTFRVRPGKETSFAGAATTYLDLVKKAGVQAQASWATYEIIAGMPGPTFMVWIPFKSLGDMDTSAPVSAAVDKAMTAEVAQKFAGLASEGYINVTTHFMRFNPRLSHLEADFVAVDPDFWGKSTP